MILSTKRKFLFIHIYKNAGTSITTALRPFARSRMQSYIDKKFKQYNLSSPVAPIQPYHDHIKASELIEDMGEDNYHSLYSFAFVRNPWDWQVSLYTYMLKNTAHHSHELVKKLGGFEAYIEWRCENEVRYQKDFIYSDGNQLLVDFVGKYENIDDDFNTICSHIGISASLPKLNTSNSKPYQKFYNDRTRELVEQAFEPDITLFKYDF